MKLSNAFSLAFYRDTLRRIRWRALSVAIIASAVALITDFIYLVERFSPSYLGQKAEIRAVTLADINPLMTFCATIIIPLLTMTAFSFLTKRNEADFFDSLPHTRVSMAISGVTASMTCGAFILISSSLLSVIGIIPCMGVTLNFIVGESMLQILGCLLSSLLGSAAVIIAVSVTGNAWSSLLVSAVILFLPRALMSMFNSSLLLLVPSLVEGHIIPIFNNEFNILTAAFSGNSSVFTSPAAYIYTLILIVLYSFLAIVLFAGRKSEIASHSFLNSIVRHAVIIAASLLLIMSGILVFCIGDFMILFSVFIFAFAVVVYFVLELLASRKDKSFLSGVIAFPVLVAISAALAGSVALVGYSMSSYSPSADEIIEVSVIPERNEYKLYSYPEYVIYCSQELSLNDERTRVTVADALDNTKKDSVIEFGKSERIFKITTKGGAAYRCLSIKDEDVKAMDMRLAQLSGYKDLWLNVGSDAMYPSSYYNGVYIGEESAELILECMRGEVAELGFEKWYDIYTSEEAVASILYSVRAGGESLNVNVLVFPSLEKTVKLLEAERKSIAENQLQSIRKKLEASISGDTSKCLISLNYSSLDSYGYVEARDDKELASELLSSVIPILTTEAIDHDEPYVSVVIEDHRSYEYIEYFDFAIKEGQQEAVISILERYGYYEIWEN